MKQDAKAALKAALKKDILPAVIWAGLMVVVSVAAKYARTKGYIDGDTMERIVAMNGLYVAYLGNAMPKAAVPIAWAQKVRRFGGWSLFLSGLLDAGLWIFAPIPVAVTIGSAAILGGIVLTIGYCFWLHGQMHRAA